MQVPFVDLANTMSDTTLPLTLHEYDEWGDYRDEKVCMYVCMYVGM